MTSRGWVAKPAVDILTAISWLHIKPTKSNQWTENGNVWGCRWSWPLFHTGQSTILGSKKSNTCFRPGGEKWAWRNFRSLPIENRPPKLDQNKSYHHPSLLHDYELEASSRNKLLCPKQQFVHRLQGTALVSREYESPKRGQVQTKPSVLGMSDCRTH